MMIKLIEKNKKKISELCRKHKVKQLYLFGSANTAKFNQESDLDFLISFDSVPVLDYADNFFALQEGFEQLFKRKVDLVVEKSIKNPYFKSIIEKTRTLLYG